MSRCCTIIEMTTKMKKKFEHENAKQSFVFVPMRSHHVCDITTMATTRPWSLTDSGVHATSVATRRNVPAACTSHGAMASWNTQSACSVKSCCAMPV